MRQRSSPSSAPSRVYMGGVSATYLLGTTATAGDDSDTYSEIAWAGAVQTTNPAAGTCFFWPLVDIYGRQVMGSDQFTTHIRMELGEAFSVGNYALLLGVSTSTDLSAGTTPSAWTGMLLNNATGPRARAHLLANGTASNGSATTTTVVRGVVTGQGLQSGQSAWPLVPTAAGEYATPTTGACNWGSGALYLALSAQAVLAGGYTGTRRFKLFASTYVVRS